MSRISTGAALAATMIVGLTLVAPVRPAGAAGQITHAWMGAAAVERVEVPGLRSLLEAHPEQVRSGAMFPDGGYLGDLFHGEEAHWARFTDAYVNQILARDDCGDLTDPDGPCAAEIAHLMGVRAHGIGDEVWDWLFEPYSRTFDESYIIDSLGSFADGTGQEVVMDLVAIGIHDRPSGPIADPPSVPDLLGAFDAAGLEGVTADMVAQGQSGLDGVSAVMAALTPEHLPGVLAEMPWMANNIIGAPGGVTYAATAIAAQWESMWGQLTGERPDTEVAVTYPADGQRRIPTAGWTVPPTPGSAPGGGGARTRIAATLSYSLPYSPTNGGPDVPEVLPEGAMTLTDVATGDPVAAQDGYPRARPYGADSGEYTIAFQPSTDLAPCSWYQVEVTDALKDADDRSVTPATWQFRTGAGGEGRRCEDDPFTAEERWVRLGYGDVLGRQAEPGGLEAWTDRLARGLTTTGFSRSLVGSTEHRAKLVTETYADYLDRGPDRGGLAFWTGRLRDRSLTAVRARILASAELYARAGGNDDAYIGHLYQLVLSRTVDDGGLAYWTGELDSGVPRQRLAASLLTTPEVSARRVRQTYGALLGRPPERSGQSYWAPRVAAADERVLTTAIVASPEYIARARAG